jgi:hypothetical protein
MWASSHELSPAWLKEHCGIECERCTVRDISNKTAPRSCFVLTFVPDRAALVLKQLASSEDGTPLPQRIQLSKGLGLAREGLFYKHLAPALGSLVPTVVYAAGDMASGYKAVIMEDLSSFVDSGALFGPGNPNNWQRDLRAYEERAGEPSAATVASVTFRAYARLHAKYWREAKLLEMSWLRGAEWTRGHNRAAWDDSQNYALSQWRQAKEKHSVQDWFDPLVFAATEKATSGVSWERQQQRLNERSNWTLVHGDCWPGNVMWHKSGLVKLVDWEMAGVGSGAQELGQYVISNMTLAVRRECEERMVREYVAELHACGVSDYSFEECWREYAVGGAERWLWFICYFAGEGEKCFSFSFFFKSPGTDGMRDWTKFFHDQLLAFMVDHKLDASSIVQVRP